MGGGYGSDDDRYNTVRMCRPAVETMHRNGAEHPHGTVCWHYMETSSFHGGNTLTVEAPFFWLVKEALRESRFSSAEEVKAMLHEWLELQP
jgi:hypothetical protein